ncbi:MAG TPA: hypothetical protein VJ528_04915 [Geothrix sp.]|nr:hypothetical protein [Geothrix sp.]
MMQESFDAVLTKQEVEKGERNENGRGIARRVSLITLTKTSDELAKIAREEPDVFMDLVRFTIEHHEHAKATLELAEEALARLISIGEVN